MKAAGVPAEVFSEFHHRPPGIALQPEGKTGVV
jgi:hypothetical protein